MFRGEGPTERLYKCNRCDTSLTAEEAEVPCGCEPHEHPEMVYCKKDAEELTRLGGADWTQEQIDTWNEAKA